MTEGSRKEDERVDVRRAHDSEMAVVEGGDALLPVPLGKRDQPSVGAAQAQVGVSGDEVADPEASPRR